MAANPNNNRRYNPYEELYNNISTKPEFLFHEEAAVQRRSWGDNVQYYTGSMYLTGAILGGTKGTFEGIASAEKGESAKLRFSRVLNSGGHVGRKYGNSLGVVGLIYAGLESGITHYRDSDDVLTTVVAGLGTGALYKAASGPRSAALAGAIGGLAAGAAFAGKQVIIPAIKRYLPNLPV